ncbi:MAG: TIGR00159 family protein [Erysipelotrichales bacterium]|nr:MAG: TIGR00159 family protein [Erysipelotrichales bacterium]
MLNYQTIQTLVTLLRMFFDILIMWILLYYTIKIVRNNSRTTQIFKGIFLILLVRAFANFFGLKTVAWVADIFVTWGFLAVIIIFQPEIRGLLEKLGKTSMFSRISTLSGNERLHLIEELEKSVEHLSATQTGALITLEQGHSLNDFINTGTVMNSNVTSELLTSIFVTTTPLHDGAVIIQGDRIACASAYFPPTNLDLPTRYGARHRAAIGISEITDSITIVISEQTGRVSIAAEGKLTTMTKESLHEYLEKTILHTEKDVHNTKDTGPVKPSRNPLKPVAAVSNESVAKVSEEPVASPSERPVAKASGETGVSRTKRITDLFRHETKSNKKDKKPSAEPADRAAGIPEVTVKKETGASPTEINSHENLMDQLLADMRESNTKEIKTVAQETGEADTVQPPSDIEKGGDA